MEDDIYTTKKKARKLSDIDIETNMLNSTAGKNPLILLLQKKQM